MNILTRFSGLFERGKSSQYEVQRQTFRGGWKNATGRSFTEPPEMGEIEVDDPGRYRCIKRVEGRIRETVWTSETADAEQHYAEQRERLERVEEMEERLEEIDDEEIETPLEEQLLEMALRGDLKVDEDALEDLSGPLEAYAELQKARD